MPISTSEYLIKKKEIETSIGWHVNTIALIDKQQETRKRRLEELMADLYDLERNFYD